MNGQCVCVCVAFKKGDAKDRKNIFLYIPCLPIIYASNTQSLLFCRRSDIF